MEPEPASLLYIFLLIGSIWNVLFPIFIILVLLILSALISGSEVAFFSLEPGELDQLEKENSKQGNRILKLREHAPKLLATILITNNLVNIGIILLSDVLIKKMIPAKSYEGLILWFQTFISSSTETLFSILNFLVTIVIVSFLLVLFGEVLPKIYASVNNLKFSKLMSGPMIILIRIFSPFSNRLVKSSSIFENKFGGETGLMDASRKEEIDKAIEFSVSQSIYENEEADILKGIMNLGDVSVKQIMKSRMDVIAIEDTMHFGEVISQIKSSGFSRIPVFTEDLDTIKGLLYVKDLLGYTEEKKNFDWHQFIRDAVLYVPEAKKIDDLLKEFQAKRLHMAIVVDEFGGTSGLVTLEDIMEEVIGEIVDEFDNQDEIDYLLLAENNYLFDGKTLLNDVCRVIDEDIDYFDEVKGASDSLAGLLLEIHGKLPEKELELDFEKCTFKVIDVSERRIEKISLLINETESNDDP